MTIEDYDEVESNIPYEYLCKTCLHREGTMLDEERNLICEECY